MDLTINRINLDIRMAKYDNENKVLRRIAKEALDFLLKNVDVNKIKGILLTGSVANSEGTVIKHISSIVTSDFDFVVYLDFPYYLKNRNHFQHLSQQMSTRLINRKVNTHVVFLPSTKILQAGIRFTNSNIYKYEFAIASKCVFGKAPSFNKTARPTKKDSLELTFTVVSDLIFSNLKNLSKVEETYIYAKRALTLLNAILIFHGFFAETYKKRIKIAKKYASMVTIPISQDEMKTLEIFTEYKLSGSLHGLLDSLSCSNIHDLIQFQKEFLTNLTTKILYYELNNLFVKEKQVKTRCNGHSQNAKFHKLLKEYSKHSTTQRLSRILGIALYAVWSFTNNKRRKELFATFVFHKQPPKALLNVLITLLLIYNGNTPARKFLDEFFPWMNSDIEPLQRTFSLWQTAEQSIKL